MTEIFTKQARHKFCFAFSLKTDDIPTRYFLDLSHTSQSSGDLMSFKTPEAIARRCSVKKVFLEFRKIHRKGPAPESLF